MNSTQRSLIYGISTHTLTWSVTPERHRTGVRKGHYNSHAHVERDYAVTHLLHGSGNYNSHAHVERD